MSLLWVCLFSVQPLSAEDDMIFEVGLKDLPSQKEGNMIRDKEGFLWFCYYGGIGRYDGHETTYFKPGENSISGPASISITMDREGTLWILTKDNGLNRYDKETNTFTHYKHDPDNPNTIASNISDSFCPQRLFIDNENRVLIGTMGGFDIYDKKTDSFTHHVNDPDNPNSISSNNVTAVIQAENGEIWIGTADQGLNKFNEKTNTWTRYPYDNDSNKGPGSNTIWSLLEDRDGTLWVGTWDRGLSRFNKDDNQFSHFRHSPEDSTSLGDNKIFYLYEDSAGQIWVCHKDSNVAGFEKIDKTDNTFIRFSADPKNTDSITSNFVSTVYEDPVTGIFWVMNTNAGVLDKFDRASRKFDLHRHEPSNPDSISSSLVLVMQEDDRDGLWISVVDALERYHKKTGKFTHYPYKKIGPKMGNMTIAMCPDQGKNQSSIIWMLSIRGVLTKFDTKTGKPLKHYTHDPGDPNSIATFTSAGASIIQDRDNPDILWLSLSSGLEKFNKTTGRFTHFVHDSASPDSISQGTVWSVYDDGRGFLWASTFGGLSRFDKKDQVFTRFIHDPENPDSIGFNKQSRVFEDSFGNFWVAGFSKGMDLMDRETGVFTHYNKSNGLLPATGINQTIQEDKNGHLWLGTTDAGLIKFSIQDRKVVSMYTKSDGLQDNHFWRSYKTKEGQMWYGGGFGLNSFYPDQVKKNPIVPPMVLTAFTQGGKPLKLGRAPEKLKAITLGWKENFFEFRFAALNYTKPEKNTYAYMLEGRDKDWYYSGTNPSGRYTGLKGGTYTLRLKGANNDGVWNEQGVSLIVNVIPPFWKTTWFYAIVTGGCLMLVWFVVAYLRKLKFEIRKRESTQKALLREKAFTETALNAQQDSFFLFEPSTGKAIRWNQAFSNTTGYTDEEIKGKKAPDAYYSTGDLERAGHFIQDVMDRGRGTIVLDLICKDGQRIPTEYSVSMITGKTGRSDCCISIGRDISNRRLAEAEKNRLESQLRYAQKAEAIGTLAGGIAHDFNNILSGIFGYAGLAEMNLDRPEKAKKDIAQIVKGAQRAAGLIQQILTFNRQTENEKHGLSLYHIINEALKLLRSSIPTTIDIRTNLGSKAFILADSTKMHQVIMNLCTNAYHAMRTNGGVLSLDLNEVSIFDQPYLSGVQPAPGKYLELKVSDTGIGMDSEIIDKVFDPYFTTKNQGDGTGLGLALVSGIVKDHGGYLYVDSQPGKGSVFTILFPVTDEKETNPAPHQSSLPKGGNERIMIIDDEESILQSSLAILEQVGYQVSAYSDSAAALEDFSQTPDAFDLIITDMTMPQITGDALAREILKIKSNIPIMLCTGYSENILEEQALAMGIKKFVQKPIRSKHLISLVRDLLDA